MHHNTWDSEVSNQYEHTFWNGVYVFQGSLSRLKREESCQFHHAVEFTDVQDAFLHLSRAQLGVKKGAQVEGNRTSWKNGFSGFRMYFQIIVITSFLRKTRSPFEIRLRKEANITILEDQGDKHFQTQKSLYSQRLPVQYQKFGHLFMLQSWPKLAQHTIKFRFSISDTSVHTSLEVCWAWSQCFDT